MLRYQWKWFITEFNSIVVFNSILKQFIEIRSWNWCIVRTTNFGNAFSLCLVLLVKMRMLMRNDSETEWDLSEKAEISDMIEENAVFDDKVSKSNSYWFVLDFHGWEYLRTDVVFLFYVKSRLNDLKRLPGHFNLVSFIKISFQFNTKDNYPYTIANS